MRQPNSYYVGIMLIGVLCSACGTTDHIRLQGSRFDLPETLPAGQSMIAVEAAGSTEVRLSPNYQLLPVDSDHPEFEAHTADAGLRASYALQPGLEIQLTTLPNLASSLQGYPAIKAKYQFRGADAANAKAGNYSLAGSLGLGFAEDKSTTSTNPGYANYAQALMLDLAGIAGYRLQDDLLLYGGAFLTPVYYRGESKQVSFNIVNQRESYSGVAWQGGVNAGVAYWLSPRWSLQAELTFAALRWEKTSDGVIHGGVLLNRTLD